MTRIAEVVAVGDELLSGARINSNAAWIGEHLAEVGVRVRLGTVVGDAVDDIVVAIRVAASRSDVVIVTGGLGPTNDDRTRDALAKALGAELVTDDATRRRIESWYFARGRTPADEVLTQALVPVGALALTNEVGTAPGLRAVIDDAVVVCLPGVPAEMESIMRTSVLPELADGEGDAVSVGMLRTVLTPETVVAQRIADVERRADEAGVSVAYLPSVAQVVVRFIAGPSVRDGALLVESYVDEATELLGDVVAVRGPGTLAEEVVRLATVAGSTIAVAESLTGGSVAVALTDVPGASAVVRGGVVAYATELKGTLLGVDGALLESAGAVDPDVASQMAAGVRERLEATYGLATTGVAGPDPQEGKAPGTVHVALAGPDGTQVTSLQLTGDRARIRAATVVHGLELVRRALRNLPPPTP